MGFLASAGLVGSALSGGLLDFANFQEQKNMNEWQIAKQKEQWEREDTAYQRTAQDMLSAGLNPLNMQGTNGAGELISPQAAQFNAENTAKGADIMTMIDNLESSKMQRDSLQSQIDAQKIANAEKLNDMGGYIDDNGNVVFDENSIPRKRRTKEYESLEADVSGKTTANKKASRELEHQETNNMYDTDTQFERILTALEDWLVGGRSEELKNKLIKKYPALDTVFKWLSGELEPELTVDRPFSSQPKIKIK